MPRNAPAIALDSATRSTLKGWVQASCTPQAQVLRSRIVLQAAAGLSNQKIAVVLQIPEVTVGKWRRSFVALGLDGLRDAPRSGRPPKHDAEVWQKVQTLAGQQPESQGRWTVRTLARELGLPHSTVHTILKASKLPLHRVPTFTFSPDPDFEAKLLDIVGLYMNPPENALILCVDEDPGIQALDRTQPLLPLRAKKPRSWTNEYVGPGTQTLIAALEMATGRVVAHVRNRLRRNPRVQFHYTPTHASWVKLIECFFSILSKQGLAHSVQPSKQDLQDLLHRFLASYNTTCSPFTWTKGPEQLQHIIEPPRSIRQLIPESLAIEEPGGRKQIL